MRETTWEVTSNKDRVRKFRCLPGSRSRYVLIAVPQRPADKTHQGEHRFPSLRSSGTLGRILVDSTIRENPQSRGFALLFGWMCYCQSG